MPGTPKDARDSVRQYYDRVGWRETGEGTPVDSAVNVDRRIVERARPRAGKSRRFPAGGRRFLDAGCGANPQTALAAGFAEHVCVDFSEVGLAKALAKLGGSAVGFVADLTVLPAQDGTFDAISCDHVLYHMVPSDQERAFQELYRVLSGGGQLWIGYTKGPHWLPEKVARALRPLGRALAFPLRTLRRGRRLPAGPIACAQPGTGAAAAGALFYRPVPVRWWRELLRRQGIQYRLVPDGWLGRRWTGPLPAFLAVAIVRALGFLCRRFPRAAFPLAQQYHIIVSKPAGGRRS